MPFLLTSIAGFSTMIGSLLIFIKRSKNIIISSLAFASGVMICVSIIDLIPESIHMLNLKLIPSILISLIGINIGILMAKKTEKSVFKGKFNGNLYKIGIISMIAIIIHNIPEGIITYLTMTKDFNLGLKLTIAIALHNIPEGISISLPIYYSTLSKKKALLYTFISGFSEVVGAIISSIFLKYIINDIIMGILYSIIAGIMLTISFNELFPESLSYKKYKISIISLIIGIIIMYISTILI